VKGVMVMMMMMMVVVVVEIEEDAQGELVRMAQDL